MPPTLTLKNIPDAMYDRLKLAAELHRRSLNSKAIVCLENCTWRDAMKARRSQKRTRIT